MNIRAFQAMNPNKVVSLHGIKVRGMLIEHELNDLRECGSADRAPFVRGSTPDSCFYTKSSAPLLWVASFSFLSPSSFPVVHSFIKF